jgi:hypothetical protein
MDKSSESLLRRNIMAMDLTVYLEDTPGSLAGMGEVLGEAGINIEGLCGMIHGGEGHIHILVDDPSTTRAVLEEFGIEVGDEQEVLVLEVEDQPGALGRIARTIAEAGINIELSYLATNTRLVIATDDVERTRMLF